MSSSTIFVSQEGPANALALNKDCTEVVIAGRNVFKVFYIDSDEFIEVCNLRVGKNLNLNFSSIDVAWSSIEENTLATAATNGAVVVWNLGKSGRSKQEHVFFDHKRTVNKVSFHLTEPSLLISGSQDGMMKCFDLRIKEVARTFFSNTESVRDVQFSPHSQNTFAAVSENGNVQLWDVRKAEKCFHQFTAHSGPVFACDWHPDCPWLATASRDKTIKVWDVQGKPSLEYTIHTIASVGHIKWRPSKKYHIASCALVQDSSINVWDVRRPYIPYATFNEHKDVTTAVAWKGHPDVFLSTSRDCTLYRHMFKDATHPAMSANPQGVSLSVKGEVVYACRQSNSTSSLGDKIQGMISRRQSTVIPPADSFHLASSSMRRWTGPPRSAFLECANKYIISGRCLAAICDHNAQVARAVGKVQVSLVWCIIKTLYASKTAPPNQDSTSANADSCVGGSGGGAGGGEGVQGGAAASGRLPPAESSTGDRPGDSSIERNSNRAEIIPTNSYSNLVGAVDDEDEESSEQQFHNSGVLGFPTHTIHIPKSAPSEEDPQKPGERKWLTARHLHYVDPSLQDWTLQGEAFPIRRSVPSAPQPAPALLAQPEITAPPVQNTAGVTVTQGAQPQNGFTQGQALPTVTAVEDQPSAVLTVNSVPVRPPWVPTHIVVEALKMHAELGDVQTSASVLLALGDLRNTLNGYLDEVTQEQWLVGYLELLARHKLWDICTLVIQGAWISSIAQLNQQSTVVHTSCGTCGKQLARAGWLCDKCNCTQPAVCSICHQVVKGLYAWCQGCSHGGHLDHMRQWMSQHKQCPTGCGHMCEYS